LGLPSLKFRIELNLSKVGFGNEFVLARQTGKQPSHRDIQQRMSSAVTSTRRYGCARSLNMLESEEPQICGRVTIPLAAKNPTFMQTCVACFEQSMVLL